jgi:hypothetical protein
MQPCANDYHQKAHHEGHEGHEEGKSTMELMEFMEDDCQA